MNSHDFDNIIKQKARQREAGVPEDIWENITKGKKKRRFPFFWWIFLILFLAGGIAIWNMQHKIQPVHTASVEKNNNDKKENIKDQNTTSANLSDEVSKKNDPDNSNKKIKNLDLKDKISTVKNKEPHSLNSDKKIRNNNDQHNTVDLNKNNDRIKNKSILYISKKLHSENDKLFSSNQNKKIRKGASRISITNAGTERSTEEVKTNSIKEADTDQSSKIVSNESLTIRSNSVEADSAIENKTDQPAKISINDSLNTKKILQPLKDSSGKKNEVALQKKPLNKIKNSGLKIEGGITIVSSIQQYKQPLFVKRILDKPNVHSEFISDNVKTKVEPGVGLTFNLIKNINKKWSAGAGIHYLRFTEHLQLTGVETNTNYTIVQRLVTDPNGSFLKNDTLSAITKSNTTLNGRNVYNNLTIPLFVRYNFISHKKLSISFTTGVYINLLRKYSNNIPGQFETTYAGGKKQADVKNTIGLDIFAGLHFSGKLHKRYEWFAESVFDYDLTPYKTNNLSFNKKIHQPGISFGISYQLGK